MSFFGSCARDQTFGINAPPTGNIFFKFKTITVPLLSSRLDSLPQIYSLYLPCRLHGHTKPNFQFYSTKNGLGLYCLKLSRVAWPGNFMQPHQSTDMIPTYPLHARPIHEDEDNFEDKDVHFRVETSHCLAS